MSGRKTPQLLTKLTLKQSTVKFTYLVSRSTYILPIDCDKFSSWRRLIRVTAYTLRFTPFAVHLEKIRNTCVLKHKLLRWVGLVILGRKHENFEKNIKHFKFYFGVNRNFVAHSLSRRRLI